MQQYSINMLYFLQLMHVAQPVSSLYYFNNSHISKSMGSGASRANVCVPNGEISREDFIFSSKIGEGGFSNVLCCMHISSKTWFAVKEISISKVIELENGFAMMAKEVKVLSCLDNPFVIKIHCAFFDVKNMYIVLDIQQGGDLRYHIKRRTIFNERMAAFIVMCIAVALNYIHSRGVIHRDVKPENIVLSAKGVPCLTDFGVSYKHDDINTEIVCFSASGTRQYLAPEVFTKKNRHGIETDFWGLGIVLYEMIYLRRPFLKRCPLQMIYFVDELYKRELNLSSTSVDFSKSDKGTKIQRKSCYLQPLKFSDSLKEKNKVQCDECTADAASSHTIFEHQDFMEHWQFVSRYIRESNYLSGKTEQLKNEASEDNVLEAEDYSPRDYYYKHQCPFYDTRNNLPQHLRPQCPRYTKGLGQISASCIAVIEGLLDLRLWSRLGSGRNFIALKKHDWFQETQLEWNDITKSETRPPFLPDSEQIAARLSNSYRYYYTVNNQSIEQKKSYYKNQLPPLGSEDGKTLQSFHYINPNFASKPSKNQKE